MPEMNELNARVEKRALDKLTKDLRDAVAAFVQAVEQIHTDNGAYHMAPYVDVIALAARTAPAYKDMQLTTFMAHAISQIEERLAAPACRHAVETFIMRVDDLERQVGELKSGTASDCSCTVKERLSGHRLDCSLAGRE